MKLQIINCLDLLYPYQVMRIVKKTSSCELVYDVKEKYEYSDAEGVILIAEDVNQTEEWLKTLRLNEKKIIWFTSKPVPGKVCWVMPKAFEKEFDFEKFVQYLFYVMNQNPEMNLFESLELHLFKMSKESMVSECVSKALKKHRKKENINLYIYIKDKVKRFLEEDEMKVPVQQFWMKGIAQEVDVVMCIRKSWVN